MLLHEVMKHCRFPRLKHVGERRVAYRDTFINIPYYKLDWNVFNTTLRLPHHPVFQEELKYCQFLLKQRDKDMLELQLAELAWQAVRDKICSRQTFEDSLIPGFIKLVDKLCDCAHDLTTNFYYKGHRRNLLRFLLLWWVTQENFRSDFVIVVMTPLCSALKNDIKQLQANEQDSKEDVEDTIDIIQEALKAFDSYVEQFTIDYDDEDVQFTD